MAFKAVDQKTASEIIDTLEDLYPDAKCSLYFKTPYQLAVATILSAQCTDARVNLVTPALFEKFPTAQTMAKAKAPQIEKLIRSTGFYRAKAKSILEMSKSVMKDHGGNIPQTMDELVKLRGIGRKTANVVLSNGFGIAEGIAVDTHVKRLSFRTGLTRQTDPVKIEPILMKIFPRDRWHRLTHLFIDHGRAVCVARSPKCPRCLIREKCPKNGVTLKY